MSGQDLVQEVVRLAYPHLLAAGRINIDSHYDKQRRADVDEIQMRLDMAIGCHCAYEEARSCLREVARDIDPTGAATWLTTPAEDLAERLVEMIDDEELHDNDVEWIACGSESAWWNRCERGENCDDGTHGMYIDKVVRTYASESNPTPAPPPPAPFQVVY